MLLASKALILMLVLLVGVPVLQVFLSRRENRWPGLLLPLLTFLYSLVMVCSVTAYEGGIPWGASLASLILGNIPTVILLAIYAACREKHRRRSEMDKMNIADL